MDQKNITLELLVRSGNPKGVRQFAESIELEQSKIIEKTAEAGVYSAIKLMWEEAEGGINSDAVCSFLNQQEFTDYFSKVNNPEILEKIIDVLQAGTHAMMEAYAQISAIDVLGVESLAGAIKRNINAPNLKEKVTSLVQMGYSLVFCPHDIDTDMVDHYFPIIDNWREFVNPREVAQQVVYDFAENDYLFEHDDKKDFVYKALDKLVELTDRETVSKLVQEHFRDSDNYQMLINDGKIDGFTPIEKLRASANANLNKALQKYEKDRFPSKLDVKNLAEDIGDDDKKYVAQKMGEWFQMGMRGHFSELAKYENGKLFDHEVACSVIGEGIAKASESENWDYLDLVLDLPQHLIDESNSAISGVVTAYRISQQTKEEEK